MQIPLANRPANRPFRAGVNGLLGGLQWATSDGGTDHFAATTKSGRVG